MNKRAITAFHEILNEKNISKAAEKLYISQSALSQQIFNLEKELGYPLFVRGRGTKEIELSEEGRHFLPIAQKWLDLYDETTKLKSNIDIPHLRVCALNSITVAILPFVYDVFLASFPKATLYTADSFSKAAYDSIDSKEIDVAFIVDEYPSRTVSCTPLFSEDFVFVSNINFYNPKIQFVDLAGYDEIYCPWCLEYELWHDKNFGKRDKFLVEVQAMELLEFFLSTRRAWAIVPKSIAKRLLKNPHIVKLDINVDLPKRKVKYLTSITSASKHIPLFINSFLECLETNEFNDILKTELVDK